LANFQAGEKWETAALLAWCILPTYMPPGLPDGRFSNQKSKFGSFLEGPTVEDVGIFYGHLVYFTAIWYTLWIFGIFCGNLVFFPVLVFVGTYQTLYAPSVERNFIGR
jgi:hypothetical protein